MKGFNVLDLTEENLRKMKIGDEPIVFNESKSNDYLKIDRVVDGWIYWRRMFHREDGIYCAMAGVFVPETKHKSD